MDLKVDIRKTENNFFSTDEHARYVDQDTKAVPPGSVPPLYDIPLSEVNRVLYKD